MQLFKIWICVGLAVISQGVFAATNYYVAASGSTPTPPWTNWAWAHTNLIEVVNRARDNDTVYVTNNAVYYLTNNVHVPYAITVRSWAPDGGLDPTNTIINGNYPDTINHCFGLDNNGAVVAGFTITNGCNITERGGGVVIQNGAVTNCIITGNHGFHPGVTSVDGGGGIYLKGAGRGSVLNCQIVGNVSSNEGGGILVGDGGGPWLIAGCKISYNQAKNGGGISSYLPSGGLVVSNCWISSNYASTAAGGVGMSYGPAEFLSCFIIGNTANSSKIGGLLLRANCVVRNCLIANNVCNDSGNSQGGGLYLIGGSVQNCTVVSNRCQYYGGGIYIAGSPNIENTVVWGNRADNTGSNWYYSSGTPTFTNCLAAPSVNIYGSGNKAENPRFIAPSINDYRVPKESPCVNAGINRTWMADAKDLDGHSRVDAFSRQVDIGAYEFLPAGTMIIVR